MHGLATLSRVVRRIVVPDLRFEGELEDLVQSADVLEQESVDVQPITELDLVGNQADDLVDEGLDLRVQLVRLPAVDERLQAVADHCRQSVNSAAHDL